MKTPVFIPSKNRAKTIKTVHCFDNRENVIIVVEPQDEEFYREANLRAEIAVLPLNDQGIAYVRNWILERAITAELETYWMLDDDITAFWEYNNGKGYKVSGEIALQAAEKLLTFQVPNIGQGALEYNQFAWAAKKPIATPGYCDVCVLMFPKAIGSIRYRPEMNLKEDRDFTLQILNAGMLTARSSQIGFAAPKNGSNPGGLSELYRQTGREAEASRRMIAAWPGVCTANQKKDGRQDVKINWRAAYKTRSVSKPESPAP